MKKFNKTQKNSEKAITLIALVITIIVILILAGISISMLSGDNGILQKATDAKTRTDEAQIRERIRLAYNSALTKDITNQNGEVQKSTLEDELENEFPNKTIGIAESTDKKEWVITIDGVTENVPIGKDTSEEPKTTLKIAEHKNEKFSTNTELEDSFGNKITVPAGFKVVEGNNVTDGIVIEDVNAGTTGTVGNQFVWVPVGTEIKHETKTIEIKLGRYVFDWNDGTPEPNQIQEGPNYQATPIESSVDDDRFYEFANDTESTHLKNENYENTKAKNLSNFIESTINKGGYYIGRYEAGISGNIDQYTLASYDWKSDYSGIEPGEDSKVYAKDGINFKPIIQSGIGVWNAITQQEAATISRNMYSSVNSDLINSYAWDTALLFIQKCGTNTAYSAKTDGNGTLKITGNNNDEQCHINDMGGNVFEWSTETNVQDGPWVNRGAVYCDGDTNASDRFNMYVSPANKLTGFRVILYL